MNVEYRPRLPEKTLTRKLRTSGCVLLQGPRQVGKQTLVRQFVKSQFLLDSPNAMALAQADPRSVLKGKAPRLIGEWQKAPDIWNHIKATLDDDFQFGRFILTGRRPRLILSAFSILGRGASRG